MGYMTVFYLWSSIGRAFVNTDTSAASILHLWRHVWDMCGFSGIRAWLLTGLPSLTTTLPHKGAVVALGKMGRAVIAGWKGERKREPLHQGYCRKELLGSRNTSRYCCIHALFLELVSNAASRPEMSGERLLRFALFKICVFSRFFERAPALDRERQLSKNDFWNGRIYLIKLSCDVMMIVILTFPPQQHKKTKQF